MDDATREAYRAEAAFIKGLNDADLHAFYRIVMYLTPEQISFLAMTAFHELERRGFDPEPLD